MFLAVFSIHKHYKLQDFLLPRGVGREHFCMDGYLLPMDGYLLAWMDTVMDGYLLPMAFLEMNCGMQHWLKRGR